MGTGVRLGKARDMWGQLCQCVDFDKAAPCKITRLGSGVSAEEDGAATATGNGATPPKVERKPSKLKGGSKESTSSNSKEEKRIGSKDGGEAPKRRGSSKEAPPVRRASKAPTNHEDGNFVESSPGKAGRRNSSKETGTNRRGSSKESPPRKVSKEPRPAPESEKEEPEPPPAIVVVPPAASDREDGGSNANSSPIPSRVGSKDNSGPSLHERRMSSKLTVNTVNVPRLVSKEPVRLVSE